MSQSLKIKKALRKAKANGVRLGNPRLDECRNTDLAQANLKRSKLSEDFALRLKMEIGEIYQDGIVTLRGVARELNKRQIPARRGGKWTPVQVRRVLLILEPLG